MVKSGESVVGTCGSVVGTLLTGTFVRSIDEKRRVAIPKTWREALRWSAESVVYMAPGTDGSLALYTEQVFSELAARLAQKSPTAQEVRAFSRLFYGRAQRVELDGQGRVRVPQELSELVSLGTESVLVGVGDHVELWNSGKWEAYQADQQQRYDEIAESAFERNPQIQSEP